MKKTFLSLVCLLLVIAMSSCGGSSKQLTDQEILVKIFETMNGPNWKEYQRENWLSDKPIGEWKNVKVNEEGRVIELTIKGDSVRGFIPVEIEGLTELEVLNIDSRNYKIDNVIPAEIGKLTKLKTLTISANTSPKFNSPTLSTLMTLVNLEVLYINGFSGAIPENIAQLSKLQSLKFDGFEGEIPKGICELVNLEGLNLSSSSQPVGAVPDCFGKLSKLKYLNIDYSTGWAGAIKQPNAKFPESIWDLTNLQSLFVRSISNAGGPIPGDKVAKMTQLKRVTINNCGINGTIPAEFFALGELTDLSIYDNNLTGGIPAEIVNCPKLSTIRLSNNQLTGNIPGNFAKCTGLDTFVLSDNQLTGNIPEGLDKSKSLIIFDLSGNKLSTNIPAALKAHPNFKNFKF